jgi:O-antigen ligase
MACYYTNSRGTILGLGTVFGAFVFRRYGYFTASACAAVGLVALLALGPSRMSQVSSEEASAQGRIQAWSAGIQMFKESPFWGVGYRQFGDIHGLVAHNAFVHVLGELGLLGAVPFVGMFYSFFRVLQRKPEDGELDPKQIRLRNELSDSAIGLLTCIMFLSRQYVVVPFVLIALGACYATMAGPRREPKALQHLFIVTSLTIGLVFFFYVLVRVLAAF